MKEKKLNLFKFMSLSYLSQISFVQGERDRNRFAFFRVLMFEMNISSDMIPDHATATVRLCKIYVHERMFGPELKIGLFYLTLPTCTHDNTHYPKIFIPIYLFIFFLLKKVLLVLSSTNKKLSKGITLVNHLQKKQFALQIDFR